MIRDWLAAAGVWLHPRLTGRELCSCQRWRCPYSRGTGWHTTP